MKKLMLAVSLLSVLAASASAQDVICDSQLDPCRERMLRLIRGERQSVDVASWFITDLRWVAALKERHQAGVRVRVIGDTRAHTPGAIDALNRLASAGIPVRVSTASHIMHSKMIALGGLGIVSFSGANLQPGAWTANVTNVDWIDEMVFTTDDPSIVWTVLCAFDDLWTTHTREYANSPVAARVHPVVPHNPQVNVQSPMESNVSLSYRARTIAALDRETDQIDLVMFRFGDTSLTDALIRAIRRGVTVRVILEPTQYRNKKKPKSSTETDRIAAAFKARGQSVAAHMQRRTHRGLTHQKTVILHRQQIVISGSSNWTGTSTMPNGQDEMNLFAVGRPQVFWDALNLFERKWHSPHFDSFTPLKPSTPVIKTVRVSPAAHTVTVTFDSGPFSTVSNVLLDGRVVATVTSNQTAGANESATIRDVPFGQHRLQIVNRTPAGQSNRSAVKTINVPRPS
jgi:phosphatidylserine/phosphatidylglycerophosphate/cardiolipin synthase-like enzyme